MHSHILAVTAGAVARGLGFALKQHQRGWCLERGVKTVEWTFDPLIGRNAYFNLNKLGADAAAYLVDFYGPMNDGINAGDESDRILVSWHLESAKAAAAAQGERLEVNPVETAGDAPRMLTLGPGGEPQVAQVDSMPAVCQVPDDIVRIRRAQPPLARTWRHALRDTLGAHLMGGGRVSAVTREGWYVLDHGPG
jgi:predicted GNAT superfamily acetyltransferase